MKKQTIKTILSELRKRVKNWGIVKPSNSNYRYYPIQTSDHITNTEIEVIKQYSRLITIGTDNKGVLSVLIEVLPK